MEEKDLELLWSKQKGPSAGKKYHLVLKFISNGSRIWLQLLNSLFYFHLLLISRWNFLIYIKFIFLLYFYIDRIHILSSFGWHNEFNIQSQKITQFYILFLKMEVYSVSFSACILFISWFLNLQKKKSLQFIFDGHLDKLCSCSQNFQLH